MLLVWLAAANFSLGAEGQTVSPKAYFLFESGGWPITNSMVTSWVVSLVLILCVRWLVGKPRLIPRRGQAVMESILESISEMIAPIVGSNLVRPVIPFLLSLFIYILIHNWSGLMPGVGNFGMIHDGHLIYWMRPGNADLNGTLALGLVATGGWVYFTLKYAGPSSIFFHIFGNKAQKGEMPRFVYYFLFLVFFGVGLIELISIAFRPVSLSFRLYGNIFGGENLLTSMTGLVSYLIPVPFYFLELLIGFVQALVFTLLVSVYIGLICNHDSDEPEGAH